MNRYVLHAAFRYFARLSIAIPPVSTAPKRSYSVEDFSELINTRLQVIERQKEAQQRYGSLLAVLRQQVDSYRQRHPRK
ncbi:MAG TPA: hypothetical protein VF630_10180 [Hymenobacter sp.]